MKTSKIDKRKEETRIEGRDREEGDKREIMNKEKEEETEQLTKT